MSNTPTSVAFKYVFRYDYNPVYVNGAHGGVSPRGDLVVNFYLERQPLPNELTHGINPDGGIGNVVAVDPEDLNTSIVRFVSNGVVLNYQNARDIHQWLGDKIAEMERLAQARLEAAGQSSPAH